MAGLSVIQANVGRSRAMMAQIADAACTGGYDVLLLQEPYVVGDLVRGMPLSSGVVYGSGGACVVMRSRELEAVPVVGLVCEEGVAVWVRKGPIEVMVVSIYCRFGAPLEPYLRYMERVVEAAESVPLLVAADANTTSPMWHSKRSRNDERAMRGREWMETILRHQLVVLNEPTDAYTFSSSMGQSDIDLTLPNQACMRFECKWRVREDWGTGDHNPITIEMRSREREKTCRPSRMIDGM